MEAVSHKDTERCIRNGKICSKNRHAKTKRLQTSVSMPLRDSTMAYVKHARLMPIQIWQNWPQITFGRCVLDKRAPTTIVNSFGPIASDDECDGSDSDVDKTTSSLRQDIERARNQRKAKMPKFVRPSKQTKRTKTREDVYKRLGVHNPERVAAVVDKIMAGELEVPAPEDGITKGKILNLLDSGSSIQVVDAAVFHRCQIQHAPEGLPRLHCRLRREDSRPWNR